MKSILKNNNQNNKKKIYREKEFASRNYNEINYQSIRQPINREQNQIEPSAIYVTLYTYIKCKIETEKKSEPMKQRDRELKRESEKQ